MRHEPQEISILALNELEYSKVMGGYKPKFEGIPEDYYPLNGCEIFKYVLFVFGIIGGSLGVMIGFIFWVLSGGLEGYTIVWSIVFLCFVTIMMVLFFVGGKSRIREEKQLIEEAHRKHEEMAGHKDTPTRK
jgi:hypothetical protein